MPTLIVTLKEHREAKGITQGELAERVGVRRETISHLEKGRYNPSFILAFCIAKALEVPVIELFTVED